MTENIKDLQDRIKRLNAVYFDRRIIRREKKEDVQHLENEMMHVALEYFRRTGKHYSMMGDA